MSAGTYVPHSSADIFGVGVHSFRANPPWTLKPPHRGTLTPNCTPYSESPKQNMSYKWGGDMAEPTEDLDPANGSAMPALRCNPVLNISSVKRVPVEGVQVRIHLLALLHPHGSDCLSRVFLPLAQTLWGFGQCNPIQNQIHVGHPPLRTAFDIRVYEQLPLLQLVC